MSATLISIAAALVVSLIRMVYTEFVRHRERNALQAEINRLREETEALAKKFVEIGNVQNNPFPDAASANEWLRSIRESQ